MSGFAQVNFRMPQELKEKLEQAAKESGRSITSELTNRLEQSFSSPSTNIKDLPLELLLGAISDRLAAEGLRMELISRYSKDDDSLPPYEPFPQKGDL